ncbi:MAG TPA: RsmB/NOP family class I SAM-dependent RNA methyltransferase [Alphaproteobacteria bacterium]|nr:RsmB/NOP family class I SAM-dependent RNA methyltransferase [Alphaproteobacteria bacterium]
MRDGARIQTAIEILEKIKDSRIPMDNTLRDYMANRRYIGSKDRRHIVELVYDIVRATARLEWWLKQTGLEDTPRSRVMAFLTLSGFSVYDITIRFTGEKHCPAVLSEKENEALAKLEGQKLVSENMPDAVQAECPPWAEDKLRPLFGEDFAAQMAAMLEPAQIDLRVNTLKLTVEQAQDSLAKDDVETIRTPYSPYGLRAVGKPYMSATKAFHKGFVEIQDEGSQLIAYICDVKPGMRVLDFCAGGGGKTLGLAASMDGKGIIFAMDNSTKRLEKGRRRYRKADVHNIEVRSLEDEKNRKWLRRQKDAMDVVLVDAPCSSSGTWRRNPDLRWNWYGPTLEEITQIQSEILERVADKVKIGGRLVYATCSLFREENENQIENFLKNHPEYSVLKVCDIWPQGYGNCPVNGDYLRLTPKDHGTDGFFTAVLQRNS